MIKIGIDGNEANIKNRVGIGEYAYQLLLQLEQISLTSKEYSFHIYLKNAPGEDLPPKRQGWEYHVLKPDKAWTQFALPLYLFTHPKELDIFFSPTHYAPRFSPIPTVISVMDVSYLHYPETFTKKDLYKLQNWTNYSVKQASKIITISKASKNDIIKFYKIKAEHIYVTYLGIKQIGKGREIMSNHSNNYRLRDKYLLFVGTLQPRKNIIRLIEAFSKVSQKYPDLQLVIVGKKGWKYEVILTAPQRYGVEDNVLFIDFVPDEDLPELYRNAQIYILPSLYEGFGLPVLEAMKYGCPVITSNVSSLPEAGGEAALYVDPENTTDIALKIEKVLSDKSLREKMISGGYEQVKKFSWSKTAAETLDILTKTVKNK